MRLASELKKQYELYKVPLILIIIILVVATIILRPVYSPPTANRCFAVMIAAIILWITNALHILATSLSIPIALVLASVMTNDEGEILPAPQAASLVISSMFDPIIVVLLATFVMSVCYTKYELPFIQKNTLLTRLATKPGVLVGSIMAITLGFCFMMPNLTAVMLAYAIVNGKLNGNMDDRLVKSILIGIAMAGNIGGYLTPISSSQSVFSFNLGERRLGLSWRDWISISVPSAILSLVGSWILIYFIYGLKGTSYHRPDEENQNDDSKSTPLETWKVISIVLITLLSLLLWIGSSALSPYFGNMAIVSLIPLILLFGLGILGSTDLASIPWDIIFLVMGASALAEASRSSGLLKAMADKLALTLANVSFFGEITIICFVILVTSTFKSHTIAGLIFVPIVGAYMESHKQLSLEQSKLLFLLATFTTSIGMAISFSGLTNLTMLAVKDGSGNRILGQVDFLKVGGPASILTCIFILLVGTLVYLFT